MKRIVLTALCSAALLSILLPGRALAQGSVTLTVTGGPLAFPAPTATDFTNGFLTAAGQIKYALSGSGGPPSTSRTTTISIHATTATLGGTYTVGHLQWQRADLATWNSISTTDTQVESQAFTRSAPWNNALNFRLLLDWTTPTGSYSTSIVITLTTTTP